MNLDLDMFETLKLDSLVSFDTTSISAKEFLSKEFCMLKIKWSKLEKFTRNQFTLLLDESNVKKIITVDYVAVVAYVFLQLKTFYLNKCQISLKVLSGFNTY